jgi:hypothetical protein
VYSLIQSDLFTFHIGEEKKAFVVHSSAVATTSGPFRALVNGDLVEAKGRSAELKDVEPADFVRFLEYAYHRDYTPPTWIHDDSANTVVHRPELLVAEEPSPAKPPPDDVPADVPDDAPADFPADFPDDFPADVPDDIPEPPYEFEPEPPAIVSPSGNASYNVSNKKKKGRETDDMSTLRSKFQIRTNAGGKAPNADMLKEFEPKSNSSADQDFTPVFLAHARLYTFADMRLIYPLRSLALDKLHKTLTGFQLYNQRVGDIVKLARYAYDHGSDRSTEGTVNSLRQLVVEYMACEVETVGKHEDFKAFLEEGGEFATDLWEIVFKYLLKV